MTVVVWLAIGVLGAAVVTSLWQIRSASDAASAAVVGDLIFFSGVAMLVLVSIERESAAVVDAVMLASLLGVLATVALARIITRGRR
ncbi:hypothetical protein GCM10022199_06050 [Marihabitans asiaticum]|uniref:Multicomponent Na+:H+ antiporter subunit F n=1 Tax=Marihabitans asiaticum TaxID=415218 RepID=A0A560WE53_9MICO|nr:monovalent cation/H+ antiporter complex subunit F [Marihabitans asiaticum]TWD15735.1 multicomponent Na+:H+ antiporter subunit F [Marihabitans asiaticum]